MAVVAAFKLNDFVASGEGSHQAQHGHACFGAGVYEAHHFYAGYGFDDHFGEHVLEIAGRAEAGAFINAEEADQLIGFGGRDYAFGGAGTDLFVLGDFNGAYYARSGWEDSAYIDDFTAGEDQLQLHGSASDYSTEATETGLWLYANGDAIAFFKGIGFLDFSAVQYRNSTAM